MNIEQTLVERVRSLPLEKQQEILDFAEFLVQKSQFSTKPQWSSDFLSTFGAWEGELGRAPQEEQAERVPFE